MAAADAPEGKPVRRQLGEVPVVAVRAGGSVFRVADGAVVRGPATAPQPAFEVREAGGVIQGCLPGAG
jgi:nitrite reductase/ring-hydroxylating ferredoxin subunit